MPDQVAPRGQKASSTPKINPQTSNVTSCHQPNPRVPWFSAPMELLCGPCHTLVLAPCTHPIPHPVLYPTKPPATPWRGPTETSSIRDPFRAPWSARSYPLPFFRALGTFSSAHSYPGRLATFPMSWPLWSTYVLAREHSLSRRLWPSRDATTRTRSRAFGGSCVMCFVCLHRLLSCRP